MNTNNLMSSDNRTRQVALAGVLLGVACSYSGTTTQLLPRWGGFSAILLLYGLKRISQRQWCMLLLAAVLVSPSYAADTRGKESKKMALIHLLARAGKNEEAANAMRSLYPNGPPAGAAALEYYRIVGNSARGWERARRGLEKLVKAEPNNLDYQLGLAQILNMRPATRHKGMQIYAKLARRPGSNKQRVLEEWRRGLSVLDSGDPGSIVSYQEYLAVDPGNVAVNDALADAHRAEARRLPWQMRDKADAHLAAGHPDEAIAILRQALQLDPKNAWVRFDLARIYHKQGDKKQGRSIMEEGLSLAPDDADMLYANALYVSLLGETENALHLIDKISATDRSPAIRRLRQKIVIQAQTKQAEIYAHDGNRTGMRAAMAHAEADAGDDAEYAYIVANAWIDLHYHARGVALMQRVAASHSSSIAASLYYARVLNRAERDDELAAVLRSLASAKELSDEEKEDLRYLVSSLAARRADNERHAGNLAAARATLGSELEEDPENIDLLMALARVQVAAHRPQKARDIYRHILQRTPGHAGARLALARALRDAGDKEAAGREMATALANAPAEDFETRMSAAEWYVGLDDFGAARPVLAGLRRIAPDDPRVLVMSGRLAKAEGDYSEAMEYFERAKAADEIAEIKRTRADSSVAGGVDMLSRMGGSPGISNLRAIEMPLEMHLPAGYGGGQVFVQVDPVRVDAGTLDLTDRYSLRRYGKVEALSPGGLAAAPAQSAQGNALAVGYEGDGMRADIGTTPLGFPVEDVVGGIKWWHYTEDTGFSLDLSRRPVTSSLLSYAGAHDPVTGEVWGGVRSSGASLHLSRDRGRLSGFVDLGYYWLTGRNVLSNTEAAVRTGFNWSFIGDDMRLTAGLAFTAWHYRENLSFYSFGHGGYYSPQKYNSIALPARWTGRTERWSYLLQGSVAASVSYEKDMLFYPTSPALQSQADANAAITTPVHTGGPGHGTGYSLTGALEYAFTPQLSGGARFEIDRSAYYAPNFAILYLRYLFEPQKGAMPYPPSPVKPYSRF